MEAGPEEYEIVSAVLGTFAPIESAAIPGLTDPDVEVPNSWQTLGPLAQLVELGGVLAGLPHGYLSDLFGRAAAGGELLGLALTAVRDAEGWLALFPDETQKVRRVIAGRAMAEMSGLWSISAAHAVTNVVARVVRIRDDAAVLDKKLGWDGRPVPFDESRASHLSMNGTTVSALARGAAATGETALSELVRPLQVLVSDPAWLALERRRHVGYHRWRPQSLRGGASTVNPWVKDGKGHASMGVGVTSGHVPPELEELVPEARAGHTALLTAMGAVFDALQGALHAGGVHVVLSNQEGS